MSTKKKDSRYIAMKLSGNWLNMWTMMIDYEKTLSPKDIMREALTLRALLCTVDADGNNIQVLARYKNNAGEVVTEAVEKLIRVQPKPLTV
jgi:hypothetical protein